MTKSSREAFEKSKTHAFRERDIFEGHVEVETLVFVIPVDRMFEFGAGLGSRVQAALKIGGSIDRVVVKTEIRQRLGARADSVASLIPWNREVGASCHATV